ncbi:MAG TPA: DNA alkylation repair protein [Chthoniobacteraceae bacterium]|jgi:3-methyladenine DNA glycosylase AlkD
MNLAAMRALLRETASPEDAVFLQRFFKTGPGEYGAGDKFLGIRVPAVRATAKKSDPLAIEDVLRLLASEWHEERLLALLILGRRFERGTPAKRREIAAIYQRHFQCTNNWDLVDLSAPNILGSWLLENGAGAQATLLKLARSNNLWERRIAVLATLAFIRAGRFGLTLQLCKELISDHEDLLHKACGWMLREVGKRDVETLRKFLYIHAPRLPRTMLRYAIERLPQLERQALLARKSEPSRER